MLVPQSCPTPSVYPNPIDCGPPSSSVHEILQVRILEWLAISFSRLSSQNKNQMNKQNKNINRHTDSVKKQGVDRWTRHKGVKGIAIYTFSNVVVMSREETYSAVLWLCLSLVMSLCLWTVNFTDISQLPDFASPTLPLGDTVFLGWARAGFFPLSGQLGSDIIPVG